MPVKSRTDVANQQLPGRSYLNNPIFDAEQTVSLHADQLFEGIGKIVFKFQKNRFKKLLKVKYILRLLFQNF